MPQAMGAGAGPSAAPWKAPGPGELWGPGGPQRAGREGSSFRPEVGHTCAGAHGAMRSTCPTLPSHVSQVVRLRGPGHVPLTGAFLAGPHAGMEAWPQDIRQPPPGHQRPKIWDSLSEGRRPSTAPGPSPLEPWLLSSTSDTDSAPQSQLGSCHAGNTTEPPRVSFKVDGDGSCVPEDRAALLDSSHGTDQRTRTLPKPATRAVDCRGKGAPCPARASEPGTPAVGARPLPSVWTHGPSVMTNNNPLRIIY